VPHCFGVRRPRALLDLSRARGREDRGLLPSASAEEQKVQRVSACRRMCGWPASSAAARHYRITPLLPASSGPVEAYRRQPQAHGGERYVAILFADIRGFTSISEGKLPYDVVFLLNRYFRATGQAIEAAGGRVDKFIGDGVMAIFGLNDEAALACARRSTRHPHGARTRRPQRGDVGRPRCSATNRHRPSCRSVDAVSWAVRRSPFRPRSRTA